MQMMTQISDPALAAACRRVCNAAGLRIVPLSEQALSGAAYVLGRDEAQGKVLALGPGTEIASKIEAIRRAGHDTVILVLALEAQSFSATDYLRAGADDVLLLPISPDEFAARISALTRRCYRLTSDTVAVGEVRAFLDGRDPMVGNATVSLTRREQDILRLLALRPGQMVTKEALFESLYGMQDDPPLAKVVEVHVCTLRKKLAAASETGWNYVQTVKRRGYCLTAPA